jgi:hypothetical protein
VSGVSGENPILMMMTFWMLALITNTFDADIRYSSKLMQHIMMRNANPSSEMHNPVHNRTKRYTKLGKNKHSTGKYIYI